MSRQALSSSRANMEVELLEARRLLSGEGGGEGLDFGDAPDSYRTTLAVNGARHFATPNLLLGQFVDIEPDGQPSVNADRDDINGVTDDEDGIKFLTPLVPGALAQVEVTNGAGPGVLNAWVDFGIDGGFHPPDQILTNVMLPGASVTVLNFVVPAGAVSGMTYARFRLAGTFDCPPFGPFGFGEVEDYRVRIDGPDQLMDFGDAPDFPGSPLQYPTTFGGAMGNPARHMIVPGAPMLGTTVDAEPDGQPTMLADGDDLNGSDDEDGVMLGGMPLDTVPLMAGLTMPIEVTNGGGSLGFLNAWFDWNQNGMWEPATEQVALGLPIPAGATVIVPVTVPGGLTANAQIYSRFRISSTAGISFFGPAPDGEVEDYRSRVLPDTSPPTVLSASLEFETRQAITLDFNEPLNPLSVSAGDLVAMNLDDGTMPLANSVIMGPGNQSATWVFNTPGTYINDGDYSFTLPAGSVSDVAGNGLAANFVLSGSNIYFLAGDADRNRTVNLADFNIMAAHFGTSGKTFSQGNFNYDALGDVSLPDFNIMAANFGTSTRPAPVVGGATFGDRHITSEDTDEIEVLMS